MGEGPGNLKLSSRGKLEVKRKKGKLRRKRKMKKEEDMDGQRGQGQRGERNRRKMIKRNDKNNHNNHNNKKNDKDGSNDLLHSFIFHSSVDPVMHLLVHYYTLDLCMSFSFLPSIITYPRAVNTQ